MTAVSPVFTARELTPRTASTEARLFLTRGRVVFALPQALIPAWTAGDRVRLGYDPAAHTYTLTRTAGAGWTLSRPSPSAASLRFTVAADALAALGAGRVTERRAAPVVAQTLRSLTLADPFA